MTAVRRLLGAEPTLIATAVRMTILAAVGFGLDWTAEQIVGLMAAVEAWLAVYARANVTPEAKVADRVAEAEQRAHVDGYRQAEDDVALLDTSRLDPEPARAQKK